MDIVPKSLAIALAVQLSSQGLKVIILSIRAKKLLLGELFTPGGMPSAHSAFVTALSTSVAILSGIRSDTFAVALVFSIIVIYDAIKIRGQIQKQTVVIKKLQEKVLPESERTELPALAGHTVPEVIAGIIYGAAIALPLAFFLP